jgi:hypothetical protein
LFAGVKAGLSSSQSLILGGRAGSQLVFKFVQGRNKLAPAFDLRKKLLDFRFFFFFFF